MPIKIDLHDGTSQIDVGVNKSTSEIHVLPGVESISDKRLEYLLRREIANRIAADEYLQGEIDDIYDNGAWYLLIEEQTNGSVDISLLNKEEEVLCTKTIHLTEKIIKTGVLDYANSKLIYTCNDDSTIELDISDIVSAIHQLEDDLAAEVARATDAEAALDDKIDKEIQDRIDDVDAEELRATTKEGEIEAALEAEVVRATQAEQDINTRIDNLDLAEVGQDGYYIKKVKQQDGQISVTKQAFDTSFSNASDNTNAPTSKTVKDYVDAETTRATNAEQAITNRIDNLDLATVGSNGGYIKTVGQQDGQLSATRQAFDTDMTNATDDNAPTTKNAKDYTDTLFTRENNRAIEEETKLGQAIEDEEDRAKLVEQGLQNSIDVEVAARGDADTAINARIDALDLATVGSDGGYIKTITQADGQVSATRQAFDTSLTGADDTNVPTSKTVKDYVDAETTRATNAESALGNRIDNLDLTEVGASGSYIKLVSQNNGQVSATSQALDTTISGSSDDTNAPTSKAVKDYVDTYGGKIDTISINGADQPIVNKNVDLPTVRTDVDNQNLSSTQKANAKTNLDLNNVDNTSDLNKPISTATQTALDDKVDKKTTSGDFVYTHNTSTQSEVAYTSNDTASTIVMRDANKQINVAQTPTSDSHAAAKKYVDTQDSAISSALTTHINDTSNPHHVTATDVGLDQVENTGDSATPLSGGLTKFTTGGAYTLQTTLQGNVDAVDDKLNVNVHIEGNTDEIDYNGDTVTKYSPYQNLKTGATGTRAEVIKLANSNDAGLMSHNDYNTILDHTRRLDALEGTPVRLIYTASQNPTAAQIKTFVDTYLAGKGVLTPTDSDYNSVSVKVNGTNHIWNYYANDGAYKDDGLDTVTQFTNNIAGIIQGSATDGFVYAESNGTGSVYGWDALKTRVTNVETGMVSDVNYDTTNKKFTKTINNVVNDIVSVSTLKSDMNLDQVANGAQVNTIESISINGVAQTITNKNVNLPAYPSKTSDLTNDGDGTSNFATESYVTTGLSGKQNTIDSNHQLDADLVDDSTSTHKFVTTQTAYANKGSATKVPQITTNTLGQVTSITEVTIQDNNDNQTVKVDNVTFGNNDVVNFTGGGTTIVTGDASTKTITITSSDSHVGDVVSVGATSGSNIAIGGTSANPTVGVASGYSIPSNTKQSQWDAKYDKPSGGIPDTDIASASTWNAKQDALTFDDAPTQNSSNPVKSGGVYTALTGKQDNLTTQTAYSAKGTSLKVPQITTNTLGQVTLIEEKDIAFPAPGDGTLTIQRNNVSLGTFTANQGTNETINISVPTTLDDISDGSTRKLSNYLPLSGGAMTGTITGANSGKGIVFQSTDTDTSGWSEGIYILDTAHNNYSTLTLGNSDKSDLLALVHNGTSNRYYFDVKVDGTNHTLNIPARDGTLAVNGDAQPANGGNSDTVDGEHASAFVHKTGDKMSGYLGTVYSDRAFYPFVSGGMVNHSSADVTGMILITLPSSNTTNTMFKFTVGIYNYETKTSCDYVIGGYNYESGGWYNVSAYCLGKSNKSNLKVRFFSRDSNGYWKIGIGEADTVWQYPQITIKDVEIGYSNSYAATWETGWDIAITTTPPSDSTLSHSVENPGFLAIDGKAVSAGSADNATTAGGLYVHSGRNNEANKIVRTDGNGYLQTGYINSNSGDEGNYSSPARIWGTNGSDSYLRTYRAEYVNVGSANIPYGFSSRGTNDWSGVSGTLLTDWSSSSSGDVMFKDDSGKINVITDGRFYQGIDIYGASKRVLDEYDLANTTWGNADTVDGEHSSAFVHKSGDTMTGALNVYSTGSNRANINLISVADVPNDFYLGSGGNAHWSITSRGTDEGNRIFLYSTKAGVGVTVETSYSTGVTNFGYRPTVNGTNVALSGEAQPANGGTSSDTYALSSSTTAASGNVRYNNSSGVLGIHSSATEEKIDFGSSANRIQQVASSTLTRPGGATVTLPTSSGTKGMAILADEGGDFGLMYVGSDGAVLANSGDNGYIFKVYDKDMNATDFTSGTGLLLGIKQSAGGTWINGGLEVNGNANISGSITNLAVNGGIYWNPYVESSSDPSDAASITVLSSGAAGGTELRISQANDSNDIINLVSPYYIYMNSKRAFDISDSWLRINENPSAGFSSGIYTGTSIIRTDNTLQVGNNGGAFFANSSGQTYTDSYMQVKNCKMQYNTSEDCLDFIFA